MGRLSDRFAHAWRAQLCPTCERTGHLLSPREWMLLGSGFLAGTAISLFFYILSTWNTVSPLFGPPTP